VPQSDKWTQVQQIFLAVADLSPGERAVVLDRMCEGDIILRGEVESLLRADMGSEGKMQTAIQTEAATLVEGSGREGCRVGAYRLIREIGRGGMGTVYLAVRADERYESEVAIKLVRPGLDTDFIFRRFRRERQILASLQHPNIARLLDAGTTEDQLPYLVMEYVKGSWITNYATEHQLGVEDRLRILLPVCSAVAYAHRAFIVHRDLKPANILIDGAGSPKLLDFGISKLLVSEKPDPAETQGVRMMTPDYASPEQIVGDPVTLASDVYSLGAVLYELMTGLTPHHIDEPTPLALERAICLEPTVAPSVAVRDRGGLARRLAGDLDNIILCAMRKEPERRYASVEHLAEDVKRHLEYRPVIARPDSPGYRVAKFVRRNRLAITLAGGVVVIMAGVADIATYKARAGQQAMASELAAAETQLGDLLLARGDRAGACDAYRKAKAAAEAVLAGNPNDAPAERQRGEAIRKFALAQGSTPR
jgi:serine/threonine protein kinase